jgi:hypothetical protein
MESPKLAGPGKKKAATGLRFGDGCGGRVATRIPMDITKLNIFQP